MARLDKVRVTFRSDGLGKREGTTLAVSLMRSGFEIAGVCGVTDRFPPKVPCRPLDLTVYSSIDQEDLADCSVVVRIDPNGQDRWRFSYQLELILADGSVVTRRRAGNELDQECRVLMHAL